MSRRKDLTLGEKLKVIQAIDEKKSQNLIAQEFEVSQSTISRIAKNREHIISLFNKIGNGHRKRKREGKAMDVELELLKWNYSFTETPSNAMLMEKAREIALNMGYFEFNPTQGWLQRWKERNELVKKNEDKNTVNHLKDKSVDESYNAGCLIEESLLKVLEIYQPEDIFNCQETRLFYNAMPQHLDKKPVIEENGNGETEASKSKVNDKDKMTLLLCCNMAGSEKLKPLIICNNTTTVKLDDNEVPVIYKTNNYGLMTTDLFTAWLEDLDKTMAKDKRQICMILNDCDEHTPRCQTTSIRLVYVPMGTTSFTHPLNHGIIQNFKALYRQQIISKIHVDASYEVPPSPVNLSVLDGIFMLLESWDQVKQGTIQNCFMKSMMGAASVSDPSESNEPEVVRPPENMTLEEFNQFVNIDENLQCLANIPSPKSKLHVPQESPSVGEMLATIERRVKAMSENGSSPPLKSSTPLHHPHPRLGQDSIHETASPMNLAKEKSVGNSSHSANSSRNQSPVMFDGSEQHPRKKNKLDKLAHRLMNGEEKSSSPKLSSTSSHSKSSSSSSSKSTPQMMPNMAANPFMQFQMLNMMQHQLNPLMGANALSPGLNPFVQQAANPNPSHQDALLALETLRQYLESRGDEACLGAFKVFDAFVRFSIMRNLQQRM